MPRSEHSQAARFPGVLLLIAGALLPSLIWLVRDHTPWPWDQAWYGEVSVDLWFNLLHSPVDWAKAMLTAIGMKPPGIVWLGQIFVPVGSLFGNVEAALLFSVLLTQALMFYLLYRIGRAIAPGSPAVGFLGIAMAAAAQSFTGLSHQFFVEPLQAVATAWVVLVALRCAEWPAPRTLLHLVGALLVGILAKATTPLYCCFPCLYIAWMLLRKRFWLGWKQEIRQGSSLLLGLGILAALPLTAIWYDINLKAVWQHVHDASSGEVALNYGFRASVGRKFVVWAGLLDQSFLSPYVGWLIVFAALAGLAAYLHAGRKQAFPRGVIPTAILCALQSAFLLLTFSVNVTVDSRYMYAMLPLLLPVVMMFCSPIRWRIVWAVLFVVCGLQFAMVQRIALTGNGSLPNQFTWLLKPQENRDRYRDVERAVRLTSTDGTRYNIVGVEEPWFNANTASFFAAKNRLHTGVRSYFTSLGYAQEDIGGAVKRVEEFRTMYYLSLDEPFQSRPPNFLNHVSLPMLEHIRNDPQFEQLPGISPCGVLIFRRR